MRFRTHLSKQGTIFFAGRNDQNNEELISEAKPEEYVFHTKAPGSPFVLIKGIPKHGDLKEAAIVASRYSRNWKQNPGDIVVHKFQGKDIYKTKQMKIGTFGVKNANTIKVKKNDIINFNSNPVQKGRLKEEGYLI